MVVFPGSFSQTLERLIRAAKTSGTLSFPAAARGHGFRLVEALRGVGKRDSWYHDDLLLWMERAHAWDLLAARKAARDEFPSDPAAQTKAVLERGAANLTRGDFEGGFSFDSDLCRSAWDGNAHLARAQGWAFSFTRRAAGGWFVPAVTRDLERPACPAFLEHTTVFPSGLLCVGASLPPSARAIEEELLERRRAARGHKDSLTTTAHALDTFGVMSLPMHARAIAVLQDGPRHALVSNTNPDRPPAAQTQDGLLAFRHLMVADLTTLARALRKPGDDPNPEILEQLRVEAAQDDRFVWRVPAGRFKVRMHANLEHRLTAPAKKGLLGAPHDVHVHLTHLQTT